MKTITVVITTYNRPMTLFRLLDDLFIQSDLLRDKYRLKIIVFNDGGTDLTATAQYFSDRDLYVYNVSNNLEPHGKQNYWRLINKIFDILKAQPSDYYIMVPDDAILLYNFLQEIIQQWESITDSSKIALNPYVDEQRFMVKQWGIDIDPEMKGFGQYSFIKTGWIDMCMLFTDKFLQELDYKIELIPLSRWSKNHFLGSGVGPQISTRLTQKGWRFFQSMPSLHYDMFHPSQMNPTRKQDSVPIINLRDKYANVVVGVATIKKREFWLYETISSIYNQVDEIFIYLDDYLENKDTRFTLLDTEGKITFLNTIDTKYPLGSSGKFYGFIDRKNDYCLAIDDDLIYPQDYVHKMITRIETNERQYLVTACGSMCSLPINNYWQDRIRYRLFSQQMTYEYVNIPGTGALAFHTDTLKLGKDDFEKNKNLLYLSDVWFASVCRNKDVTSIVTPHKGNWVRHNPKYDDNGSIYSKTKDDGVGIANMIKETILI